MFFLFLFALAPILLITVLIFRKSALIQQKLNELEQQQKELLEINNVLEIERSDLLNQQDKLKKKLEKSLSNLKYKNAQLEVWQERQKEFHSIQFTRISGWGSPAYTISVDALGHVLFEGKSAVRKIGFFQWKIYRKRILNLNHIINKSHFFEIQKTTFRSAIEEISQVEIEIFLKNGSSRLVKYDHASRYPIQLGFLEQKLDLVLGTKKLWLYWEQEVVRLSIKKGIGYKANYLQNQGLFYSILGVDYYTDDYNQKWTAIDILLQKHEAEWLEETHYSYKNHPKNTIWIELKTGFKLLIDYKKQPKIYSQFLTIINTEGTHLKSQK